MTKEVITVISCEWCNHSVELPSRKRRVRGYIEAAYPESWKEVEGKVICTDCKHKYLEMVKKLENACANNGNATKKKSRGSKNDS